MAQTQYQVGTKLTNPFGGNPITVSDSSLWYSDAYKPIVATTTAPATAPVQTPTSTAVPVSTAPALAPQSLPTPAALPPPPAQPYQNELQLMIAQGAKKVPDVTELNRLSALGLSEGDLYRDPNSPAIYVRGTSPFASKVGAEYAATAINPVSTSQTQDRLLGPTEYTNLRTQLNVGPSNFDQYFRKDASGNIFLKASVIAAQPKTDFKVGDVGNQIDAGVLKTPPPLNIPASNNKLDLTSDTNTFIKSLMPLLSSTPEMQGLWQQQSQLTQNLADISQKYDTMPQRLQDLQSQYGVSTDLNAIKELDLRIAQKNAAYQQGALDIQNQPISQGLLIGQKQALLQQQAVDIGMLTAQKEAYQGNLTIAQDLASQALEAEFKPVLQQIDLAKSFLQLNQDNLTAAEKRRADAVSTILDLRKEAVQQQQDNKKQNSDLALEVASRGGDPTIIDVNAPYFKNIIAASPILAAGSRADHQIVDAGGESRLISLIDGHTIMDLGPSTGAEVFSLNFDPITGKGFLLNKKTGETSGLGTNGANGISTNVPRAVRNNNPYNIKQGAATQKWIDAGLATLDGVDALDGGHFLVFKDVNTGVLAATDLLFNSGAYTNLTVDAALKKWSGNGYGATAEIASLANKRVGDLTPPEVQQVLAYIPKKEGYTSSWNTPNASGLFNSDVSGADLTNSNQSQSTQQPTVPFDSLTAPYLAKTDDGIQYVDLTNASDKVKQALVDEAHQYGIQALDSAQVTALKDLANTRENLNSIESTISSFLPKTWYERLWKGPLNRAKAQTQSDPNISSYETYRLSAIAALRAAAGTQGLRITETELNMAISNLPEIDDTLATAQGKLDKIRQLIQSKENSLINPNGQSNPGDTLKIR